MQTINLAGILSNSLTNGEGLRYVIFVQGCSRHCKNCQNKHTWDHNIKNCISVETLFKKICNEMPLLNGVTFSGGEPFEQVDALTELAKLIKTKTNLNIWCYSGYTLDEIKKDKNKNKLLEYIDVLVDGEFKEELKDANLKYRGSSNQQIIRLKNKSVD